jgi:hypothetical protein
MVKAMRPSLSSPGRKHFFTPAPRISTPRLHPSGYTRAIDDRNREISYGHPFHPFDRGFRVRPVRPGRPGFQTGEEMTMDILALCIAGGLFAYLVAALGKPEWFE